ncbi:MAG: hypothetical protein ACFFCS_29015 [Candidatus Hodarchaeota archaeon]
MLFIDKHVIGVHGFDGLSCTSRLIVSTMYSSAETKGSSGLASRCSWKNSKIESWM